VILLDKQLQISERGTCPRPPESTPNSDKSEVSHYSSWMISMARVGSRRLISLCSSCYHTDIVM